MFTTGHGRVLGELLEPLVARPVRRPIARDVAGEHERRVAHRLPARELQLVRRAAPSGGRRARTRPASNDMRVRVEGCSNSSATVRPASAREAARRRLERERAVEDRGQLARGASSAPVRKCRGKRGSVRSRAVRVLTWNLFHGRSVPPRGAALLDEFAARAGRLGVGRRAAAGGAAVVAAAARGAPRRRAARTCSPRATWLLPLRRAIAGRNPDLLKSNGGGCNAILVRGGGSRRAPRRSGWRCGPERRWAHGVRLASGALGRQPARHHAAAPPASAARPSARGPRHRARLGGRRAARARRRLQPARHARAARAAPRRRPLRRPRLRRRLEPAGRGARCSTAARSPTTRRWRDLAGCVGRSRAASAARAGRRVPGFGNTPSCTPASWTSKNARARSSRPSRSSA